MSGKKTSKSKIRNTLIVIGIIAVAVAAAYILLFMPLANVPAWMSDIRNAFYGSAFYSDFENNFIADKRYMYIVKGLGVIVALVRSSYDTLKEELKGGFGKAVLYFFYKLCGIYLTVIRSTSAFQHLMIIYFFIFVSSNNKIMVAVLAFGINSGAYVAEIIRGGIMSIDK